MNGLIARLSSPKLVCLGALILLFYWSYFQHVDELFFVMDDYIETQANLAAPLSKIIRDNFTGELAWSGYRPVSYSARAVLAHLFSMEYVAGYHIFGLGLHLCNSILLFLCIGDPISKQRMAVCGLSALSTASVAQRGSPVYGRERECDSVLFRIDHAALGAAHSRPASPNSLVDLGVIWAERIGL